MKVYIEDQRKLEVFQLPDKIEDEFIINYESSTGVDETITLTAENASWNIASSYGVSVSDGVTEILKKPISDNDIFKLKFIDLDDNITFYSFKTPVTYYSYKINQNIGITLGTGTENDICYKQINISQNHFKIYQNNGHWMLDDLDNYDTTIFINNKRAHKQYLNLGDIIFTNGLKIIWMNNYVIFNNPNNLVTTRLEQCKVMEIIDDKNEYTPVKDTEKNAVLYDESQVFFHTPRLRDKIEKKVITIEQPPQKENADEEPTFLTYGATIMMGLSSSITGIIAVFNVISGKATFLSSITEIVICIAMLLGMILFPIIQDKYRKIKKRKKEKIRQAKYTNYLNNKHTEIQDKIKEEINILFKNNLNVNEILNAIVNMTPNIWSREIIEDDFLNLRLGLGNKPASIEVSVNLNEFSLEDDNLIDSVKKIRDEKLILNNVPITISLIENNVLPIIISDSYLYKKQYVEWLLLQLISYYSGVDLKIAVFTTKENEEKWNCFKYLPHCFSNDKKLRLFATNEDEYKEIAHYLDEQYIERVKTFNKSDENNENKKANASAETGEKYKLFDKYFLIVTDNYISIKNYEVINKIIEDNNLGFSILIIENHMSMIPSRCKCFIDINNANSTIYTREDNNKENVIFTPEFFQGDLNAYARVLANIPAFSLKTAMSLPQSYNFLEMYKVGKIEQLNIINRWLNNDTTTSLNAPIGIKEDGKLSKLDLHEKNHGPHGLIAGSTGSGKSEFIITYILSMAINYHPENVQFILIDYKGGGLAGAFENKITGVKLPHLVGTITNLDTNEMNRTLVSINSELKRREHIFNEVRDKLGESTVDIYKYQQFYKEGKVTEPIAHLFIISDEFAELKQQQPEFMDELVSAARIGRSLGVHLILATQKPSGVVNDQIWSNSRFKVCLKVQNTDDSNEMLKRPEAASIKETGRFYLQVGYNEIFELAQSAWAGAKYTPTERILKSYDDSIDFIDHNGNVYKTINDKEITNNTQNDYGDQLTNIVKFLNEVAQRENIKSKPLWLPSIPETIYLSNIIKKYNFQPKPYQIVPIIGEYDMPEKQQQDILTIDLIKTGNVLIIGNAGSGKDNLLTTMIYSSVVFHSTTELNVYIFDFGAETLKVFNKIPHVGDVVLVDEKEKVKSAVTFFERELTSRKELFSESGGTFASYNENNEKKVPLIMVVINSYDTFEENYSNDLNNLVHIFRDGYKYGIVFIMTAMGINSLPGVVQQMFSNKIATRLADNFDYKYNFNAPFGLVPAKYFGRGIITIDEIGYEFQTAYVYKKNEINDVIKNLGIQIKETYAKVGPIPVIPAKVTADTLSRYIDNYNNIPLGINIRTGGVLTHDFIKNNLIQILGNDIVYRNDIIENLIKVFKYTNNCNVKVIDFHQLNIEDSEITYITDEYTNAINEISIDNQNISKKTIYIFIGTSRLYDLVLDEGISEFNKILTNVHEYKNCGFVLIDNYPIYKRVTKEAWFNNDITTVWVGEDVKVQNIANADKINSNDANEEVMLYSYYLSKERSEVMKIVGSINDGGIL